MIVIELSGPPVTKARHRSRIAKSKTGAQFVQTYADKDTVKYETQLKYAGTKAMAGRAPIDGPVEVVLRVGFPIPAAFSKKKRALALLGMLYPTTKPDWDNLGKVIGDGLNFITWLDDKQIVNATVLKRYTETPGMRIEITALTTPEQAAVAAAAAGALL